MLEVIAVTLEDTKRIEACGADRIELVSALSEGGLTPSYGLIKSVVEAVNIPVNVMVRPHSHSFVYAPAELGIMVEDIKMIESIGANGVVFGALKEDGTIDLPGMARLCDAVIAMEITCHRAIDASRDPLEFLTQLKALPKIERVLTSGGPGQAIDHIAVLKQMNKILEDRGHHLLVGSGISVDNFKSIMQGSGAREIHIGTSVRKESSVIKEIDSERLATLVAAYK